MRSTEPGQTLSPSEHDPYEMHEGEGLSLSHLVHTLQKYAGIIVLSLLSVVLLSGIVASVVYLRSPSQQFTSLPFRLEFQGANRGQYPNGTKFSTTEITATPILLKVYKENDLARFVNFERFSRAIFVLESSQAYEVLVLEYQARLSDAKLSPVDRERIQKEYELKRASLGQADYSLNFVSSKDIEILPASTVNKVLSDILKEWANYTVTQKKALQYRVSVLSANIIQKPTGAEAADYILGTRILRSRIDKVLRNIEQIKEIPGAELARTAKEEVSLDEARLRLEDIVRFRIEPLIGMIRAEGLVRNQASTIRFLEEQLTYDTRELKEAEERTRVLRDALSLYTQKPANVFADANTWQRNNDPSPRSGQTVMPQLGESFLDQLVNMTGELADREYRQKTVDQIKDAGLNTVPLLSLVQYDQQLIETVRKSTPAATPTAEAEQIVQRQFDAIYADVSKTIADINEIYATLSRNLNPSTELFTLTAPPTQRTERTTSLKKLFLYGIVAFLISIPVILGAALLHNRFKKEEAAESTTAESAETPV